MKRMALFPPQPSKQNDNANTGVFNLPPQPRAVTPNNTMLKRKKEHKCIKLDNTTSTN